MKNKRTRYSCAPPDHPGCRPVISGWSRISVLLAWMLAVLNIGTAQDFTVTGTVNNTGIIRVKKQVAITQPALGGELDLKGADQTIEAKQYDHLRLTGPGIKTTIGGNFSVLKNLTIASPVTLDIAKGTIITLGDTLFESGIMKGAIQKKVNLAGATTQSDFGRIGAAISWSTIAPESTNVVRVSDSTQFGEGNQSIRRYYDIQLNDATKTGTVTFKYADSELNGHIESNLQLWRSTDNGTTWVRHIPVVDTQLKTLSKANVPLKGLWTASDTLRALGPLQGGAGIPASIARASIVDSLPVILTTLDTFKVMIADIYGTPVKNVPVSFAISKKPGFAFGDTLTASIDSTDSSGIAWTLFTVGSKVGQYEVTATAKDLDTVLLTTTARHGAPKSLADIPITLQSQRILTLLDTLFTVEAFDIGGNPVNDALVTFVIDSIPSTLAVDQVLSAETVRTDPFGHASTKLTLGTKVGIYGVKATIDNVEDTVHFFAKATVGTAATMATMTPTTNSGIVGSTMDPLAVTLFDIGQNPVDNDTVLFKIVTIPFGSDSGRLSSVLVPTDAQGSASTILTLGTKVGTYIVSAENVHVGIPAAFTYTATHAPPDTLLALAGDLQISPILTPLANDFVVSVTDTFGNAVDSAWVVFRMDSLSASFGARLSADSVLSDISGLTTNKLTLGSKTGPYRVNATVNGVPVLTLEAFATAGMAVAMIPAEGLDQKDTILTDLDQLFTVRITDIGGNPVPAKSVQFVITDRPAGDTSAVLSALFSLTDSANGFASTRLRLGSKVGPYTVKATVTTPPAATDEAFVIGSKMQKAMAAAAVIETSFTAIAKHGAASTMLQLFGDHQINPTESELDTAFVVALRDIGDNPVLNEPVRFTVVSAPENATNQAVLDSVVFTDDTTGIARTFLRLGTREGLYTVTASVKNVPVDTFFTTAYFLYGDINKDIDLNIADITSLVDILNRKIVPTASDSLKADFNHDQLIDDKDIETIRRTILDRSIYTVIAQPSAFLEEENNPAYIAPVVKLKKKVSATAKTVLEATPYGLRVNLLNDEPVRGIEMRLHLKDSTIAVNSTNMIFKRAEMMDVFVSTKANEVRVIAYNMSNTEIQADSGSIFRLPSITSLDMIDTTEVTIALHSNMSAPLNTETVTAPVGTYPVTFRLSQNYPNPFNGSTTIEYDIPDGTELTKTVIQVFNILGQRVKTLVSEEQQPGRYTVRWDGTDQNGISVASGVYFYRLSTKSHVGSRKMIYVK